MDLKNQDSGDTFLEMVRFTIDEAPIAVFWMNREAGFSYVNEEACRSLGYTRDELMALRLPDIDPIYPMEKWKRIWEKSKSDGEIDVFHIESVHRRKDGSPFPVEIDATPYWFGETEFHVAFVRDNTDRK